MEHKEVPLELGLNLHNVSVFCIIYFRAMNKKKKEENRIKRGLLTFDEHMQKRDETIQRSWEKSSKKNRGKKMFGK